MPCDGLAPPKTERSSDLQSDAIATLPTRLYIYIKYTIGFEPIYMLVLQTRAFDLLAKCTILIKKIDN